MALDLIDYSTNSNDLTNSGITESSDTPFVGSSTSANFDNSSFAYIADASQTGLDFTTTWTIEAWVKVNSVDTNEFDFILAKQDTTGLSEMSWGVYLYQNGAAAGKTRVRAFAVDDGGSTFDAAVLAQDLEAGVWYHIAVTCDVSKPSATTFEFFINGESKGNGTMTTSGNADAILNTDTPVTLGSRWNGTTGSEFMDGLIDEVRVWNDIRTPTEISTNKDTELTGSESGLVAYYPFETIGAGVGRTVIGSARVAASSRVAANSRTVHPGRTTV